MNLFTDYFNYISEVESKVMAHAEEIGMCFFQGKMPAEITDHDTSLADRHNNGRMTMKLTTDAGCFMYKPHPLAGDIAARGLFEKYFDDIIKVPKTIDYDSYGFAEYIENRPADNLKDAKKYFYNLGGIAAIAHAIGMGDLVMENFLAEGPVPVFVDSEFFLSPVRPSAIGRRDLEGAFGKQVRAAFEQTAIFGFLKEGQPVGLLNCWDFQNKGLPVIDGVTQKTFDYTADILQGYEDVYRRCMENKEGIMDSLSELKGKRMRVFVRSTEYYFTMVKIAKDPRLLESEALKKHLFGRMADIYKTAGLTGYEKLLEKEQESILKEDIPMFWAEPSARDLYFGDECVFEGFFEKSMIENAKDRLDALSDTDMVFSKELLGRLFESTVIFPDKESVKIDPDSEPIDAAAAVSAAKEIFEKLYSQMLTAPDGSRGLISVRYASAAPEPCDETIGMGITGAAVFAAAVKKILPECEKETAEVIDKALSIIEIYIKSFEDGNLGEDKLKEVGFFSGYAGILEGLLIIKQLVNDERVNNLCTRLYRLSGICNLGNTANPGIYNGPAGFILALCDERNEILDQGMVKKAADILISEVTSENYKLLSGFGNGISGIGTALLAAYKATSEERFLVEAHRCFDEEHELYRDELSTWPDLREKEDDGRYMHGICSGAPGIAIAMSVAEKFGIETAAIDKERALNAMRTLPALHADRVCCGNASLAEALLTLKDYEDASKILGKIHDRYKKTGELSMSNPGSTNAYIPGLMFGCAGVGYEFLRFAYPDIIPGLFDFGLQ